MHALQQAVMLMKSQNDDVMRKLSQQEQLLNSIVKAKEDATAASHFQTVNTKLDDLLRFVNGWPVQFLQNVFKVPD